MAVDIRALSAGKLQLTGTVIGYVSTCGAVRCSLRNVEIHHEEQAPWLHCFRAVMAVPANFKNRDELCARSR